ncbi:Tyrosine recombinase XerC [subsurface metagenome]
MLAVNTGLRKSEILNLKWKDFRGNEISVNGKGDKNRRVPLNLGAKAIIIKQPRKNEWVFDIPNRHQSSLFKRTVEQIKKRTGINFHFHLLRHHFTTKLMEKGIDFVTISELLGHSKISTSLIYSHTNRDRKERAVKALE